MRDYEMETQEYKGFESRKKLTPRDRGAYEAASRAYAIDEAAHVQGENRSTTKQLCNNLLTTLAGIPQSKKLISIAEDEAKTFYDTYR